MTEEHTYQRGLKQRHISLIALGGIIGSSYFLGTGYVLDQVGPAAFLAYALGGLITFLTMACLAELTTASPVGGGSFVAYSTKYVSPSWACGVGWSYWISWVVYIPSECIAAGILMHYYTPTIPVYTWAIGFGFLITIINLLHVKVFGELEFWLALIKIFLLISFSLLAIFIFLGWIGKLTIPIGGTYLFKTGGFLPNGVAVLLMNMVVLLSNFQGSEIIGLTAAESHDPHKSVPSALKKVSLRIVGLYLVPTFLVAVIFPWNLANLSGSVFSIALAKYGLHNFAHVFSFLIIAGALSCANSGLYATIRSLHGLAMHDMGPKILRKMNRHGIPVNASLVSVIAIWIMLLSSYFFSAHSFYANLLAISGFTGSMCWISICWAQLRFRKHFFKDNLDDMVYRVKLFPYLTILAIWLQVICLFVVIFSPDLRMSFYLGAPVLIIPILLHKWLVKAKAKRKK